MADLAHVLVADPPWHARDQLPGPGRGRQSGKRHCGMGRYVRMGHETCIIAARGKALRLRKSASVRSVFDAPMPVDEHGKLIHSAKPEEFFDIVAQLIEGPYLELFARRRRPNWDCRGKGLR